MFLYFFPVSGGTSQVLLDYDWGICPPSWSRKELHAALDWPFKRQGKNKKQKNKWNLTNPKGQHLRFYGPQSSPWLRMSCHGSELTKLRQRLLEASLLEFRVTPRQPRHVGRSSGTRNTMPWSHFGAFRGCFSHPRRSHKKLTMMELQHVQTTTDTVDLEMRKQTAISEYLWLTW